MEIILSTTNPSKAEQIKAMFQNISITGSVEGSTREMPSEKVQPKIPYGPFLCPQGRQKCGLRW